MAEGDAFITCENKDRLPIEVLRRAVVRKDANGKHYINVVLDTFNDCDNATPGIDCDNAQRETAETMERKCYIFDACGNLALRLGTSTP